MSYLAQLEASELRQGDDTSETDHVSGGVESGGGDASPAVNKLGGGMPLRFESEVAHIPGVFYDFRVFSGRLATLPTIRLSHSKIRGDTPAREYVCVRAYVPTYLCMCVRACVFVTFP